MIEKHSAGSSHLSVSADLDPLVVVPWVEDVLGTLERNALLTDPLHIENPSQSHEAPVLAVLLTDGRHHTSVTL